MSDETKFVNGIDIGNGCPVCGNKVKDKGSFFRCEECPWFEPDFNEHSEVDWQDESQVEIAGLKKIIRLLKERVERFAKLAYELNMAEWRKTACGEAGNEQQP